MVVLRQIEKVTASFAAASNVETVTLDTALLDITKAYVVTTCRGDSDIAENTTIAGRIISTTQVEFERSDIAGDSAAEVVAYVCEFISGVNVERGETEITTASVSVDLGGLITDVDKSWINASFRAPGTGWSDDECISWKLTAGSPISIDFEVDNAGGTNAFVAWEVIEYEDCVVQRGSAAAITPASATSTTQAITAVDLTKSMVLASFTMASASSPTSAMAHMRARFTADDELTFDRGGGASVAVIDEISWEVVEFTDNTVVQEIAVAFPDTDLSEDDAVDELSSLTQAMAVPSVWNREGKSSDSGTNIGVCTITADLTSVTNLQSKRDAGSGTCDVVVYVVDFGVPAALPKFPRHMIR